MMSKVRQYVEELLDRLAASENPDEQIELQNKIYAGAYEALGRPEGAQELYPLAHRFEPDGVFSGSDWAQPANLQAGLVERTLESAEGIGVECCSQLRLLAIASGDVTHPRVAAEEARSFLEHVLALNLDSIFPLESYARPEQPEELRLRIKNLFQFIVDSLGADGIMTRLVQEANRVLLTRPIKIEGVRRMIETASHGLREWEWTEIARDAMLLVDALEGPTPLTRVWADPADYVDALSELDDPAFLLEADAMANSMRRTGLVCPHHAALVKTAADKSDRLLGRALGIEDVGRCSVGEFRWLVGQLIDWAIHPPTAQAVYGLAQLLDRGVLFHAGVVPGLRSLLTADVLPTVADNLLAGFPRENPPCGKSALLAGVLEVLGQPRGVDQGHNPTCQSARAISLWAQNDPAYLLRLILQAARDGNVRMYFEGQPIDSSAIERGVAEELHTELDSISLLLTPHVDRLYVEMSRRALDREEDEHKWVNPELHGSWVRRGFAAIIDEASGVISEPGRFLRQFYASYHPTYNGDRELAVPQPAGVAITNLNGTFLDWHAISLQRIDVDPQGQLRVYFFNPNHDKGQNWGQGIITSTSDRGELMGESSLPFFQFASRLYVFHFEPAESGDPYAVPEEEIEEVLAIICGSWGRAFGAAAAVAKEKESRS